jgi:hypothetical protein
MSNPQIRKNTAMIQLVGILMILNTLALSAWWLATGHPYPKSLIVLCTIACAVGLALVFYERGFDLDLLGNAKFRVAAQQAVADANEIAEIKKRVENQSATVDLAVTKAVEAEREIAETKKRVEAQSDAVSSVVRKTADVERVAKDLSEKNQMAEEKLSALQRAVTAGNSAVGELKAYVQFSSAILAAQNDDRRAYDQLWAWAHDSSSPLQRTASQVVQTLLDQHDPVAVRSDFAVSWKEGIDPYKLALSEFSKGIEAATPHYTRVGILEFVWEKRTDIPKRERLQFLVDVLRTDQSLLVVEYAGRYFAAATGDALKPIAIAEHLKWWEEHRDSIK